MLLLDEKSRSLSHDFGLCIAFIIESLDSFLQFIRDDSHNSLRHSIIQKDENSPLSIHPGSPICIALSAWDAVLTSASSQAPFPLRAVHYLERFQGTQLFQFPAPSSGTASRKLIPGDFPSPSRFILLHDGLKISMNRRYYKCLLHFEAL